MNHRAHEHPDFANVIRVAKFHRAPQRIQAHIEYAPVDVTNVVILPVIRIDGYPWRRGGACSEVTP